MKSPPERVGPYLVGEHLASGGMGDVYRGMHERLRRPVALKQVRGDRSSKSNARRRFLREARATARLNHPSIVQVHDILEEDGSDWLVMELVDGPTLKQILSDGPIPWPKMVPIALQIAEGIGAAHEAGIIHRDLKTENVIVTTRGQAKILDFGLAKSMQEDVAFDPGISHEDAVIGTPRIMSPEQAHGRKIDLRTDLFSFGVLLYETLTCISPFVGASTLETLTRICHRPHEPLRRYVASIPEGLESLVTHLLQKDADKRPDKAAQVIDSLQEFARSASEFGSAYPLPTPGEPTLADDDLVIGTPPSSIYTSDTQILEEKEDASPLDQPSAPSTSPSPILLRERRQVTLLWCNLEVSPPERAEPSADVPTIDDSLSLAMQEAARIFGGRPTQVPAQVPGQHFLLCFGFPLAHEDDPQRAVHAALHLLASSPVLPEGATLRIGIHTGPAVVLPELAQSEPLAFGATLDQVVAIGQRAEHRKIFLSATTRRLLDGSLRVEKLGPVVLPGIDQDPQSLYRFLEICEHPVTLPSGKKAPLFGRHPEIDLLASCWQRAAAGRSQVVEICGEAGIGKSHLARSLAERLQEVDSPPRFLTATASPFARRAPLQPVIHLLRGLLDLDLAEKEEIQLQRLARILEEYDLAPEETLPLIAAQFSLPHEEDHGQTDPRKKRLLTLEALAALLLAVCEKEASVLLFEDLHQVDPSTLDFLQLLIRQEAEVPLLLVLTLRPELTTPWSHRADLIQIRLQPLQKKSCEEIIDHLVKERSLPSSLREQILRRADGIPLFLEAVTKALLEADDLHQSGSKLPLTLRDSLVARLDRLDSARALAQMAAVIGREFRLELLDHLVDLPPETLRKELDRLVDAEILLRRGFGKRAHFVFKHVLIRDAAYESLLPRGRRAAHARIVEVLQEHFPDNLDREPEALAYHAEAAGDLTRAIAALRRAAKKAMEHSALLEAIQSYRHALNLLCKLPGSTRRDGQELELRLALGSSLMSIDGYGAPEVGEHYARAEELCHSLDDEERLFSVLWGMYAFRVVRAELSRAIAIGAQLLDLANANDHPLQRLEAHQANGLIRFYQGTDLDLTLRHLEQVAEIAEATKDRSLSFTLRHHNVEVTHLCFWGLSAWLSGDTLTAIERCDRAIDLARRAEHPYSLTFALNYNSWLGFLMRDPERTLKHAEEEIRIAEENGFFWMHIGMIFRGWALAERGELRRGIQLVRSGCTGYLATGGRLGQTLHLAIEAELCLKDGRLEEAGDALDEAMMMAEGTGEQMWKSELWRLRSEWLRATGMEERADEALLRAREAARASGARALGQRLLSP